MPFCPECRAEYSAEIQRCPECGVDLRDTLPEDAATGDEGFDFVTLASFPSYPEAEMIKELLEANGVPTVLRGEADPIGVASGATPTTLLVEERDAARARELYDAYFAGETTEDPGETSDAE